MSGVGLANRFAFLEEDGTSSGAVSAPQVKPAAATAQKPQGTNQRTTGQQQQQQQQQRAPQQQQRPRPARPVQTGDFEHRPEGTEGSERGNRRGGFRGGRGGQREGGQREGGRPPKREFDRHSGSDKTGVKAIEKKGSRFNWGSDETKIRRGTSNTNNRRINEERADSDEDTASAVASETPAPLAEGAEGLNAEGSLTAGESSTASTDAAAATTTAAAAAPKEEEGPKLLTLEEFKRLQEASAPKTELPKLRQAGENVDNSQWKNAVALTKNDDTEFFVPKKATTTSTSSSSSSSSASSSSSSSNKPKKVEVNITFFDPEQQRNERFDRVNKDNKDNKEKESSSSSSSSSASPSSSSPSSRGGNSGRGGRGGKPQTSSRGGYRSKPNFDVNDQKVFPTLGGK